MSRLKDYFHFQKEEKIAFFFLVGIILGVIVFIQYNNSTVEETSYDFSNFEKKIELFETSVKEQANSDKHESSVIGESFSKKDPAKNYSLFLFDPNGLSIGDWMKLGLSRSQAEVIKNYEKKGGRFYDKEDVKKMYSISAGKFQELEPYIKINKDQSKNKSYSESWEKDYVEENYELQSYDLNMVDSINLLKLKGIGPSFSSRILKYREQLGGFHHVEQLLEIWGMDSIRLNQMKPSVYINGDFELRKININNASAARMKDHPYISWNVANSIEKYREQNGNYKKLEEIKKSHLINDSLFQKLLPYIELK